LVASVVEPVDELPLVAPDVAAEVDDVEESLVEIPSSFSNSLMN
jgi:hypothetical protein